MKKIKFLTSLVVIWSLSSIQLFAQEDSLAKILAQKKSLHSNFPLDSSLEFVLNYYALGEYYSNQYEADSAIYYLEKAKSTIKNITSNRNSDIDTREWTTRIYDQLSLEHQAQGNIENAFKYAQLSLDVNIERFGKNSNQLFPYYSRIGNLLDEIELYSKSIDYYKKAIYVLQREHTLYPMSEGKKNYLAQGYANLGYACKKWRKIDHALAYYELSMNLIEDEEQNLHLLIDNYRNIAHIQMWRNGANTTLTYLKLADSLWLSNQEKYINDEKYKSLRGKLMWNFGYYWKIYRNYPKAKFYLKKAFEIWEECKREISPSQVVTTLMHLSEIYDNEKELDFKNRDTSIYFTQIALTKACKKFNSIDINELPTPEDFRDGAFAYQIFNQLARFNQRRGEATGDLQEHIEALELGISYIYLADKVHSRFMKEKNRRRSGQNLRLIENSVLSFDYGVFFADLLNEFRPSQELEETAFYFTQRKKAQQLWSAFMKDDANNRENVPDSLLKKEKELYANILKYEQKLIEAERKKDKFEIDLIQNEYLFENRRDYETLKQKIELEYPNHFESRHSVRPVTTNEIQEVLEEDELVVDFSRNEVKNHAFIITKNQPLKVKRFAVTRAQSAEITAAIWELKKLLQNSTMIRKSSRVRFIELSNKLYNHFVKPIEKELEGKRRLIVIGDGYTNYIPFEVLLKSNEEKPFYELDYLIEKFEISYHYSTVLFVKSRQKSISKNTGTYTFAPVYDYQGQDLVLSENQSRLERIDTTLRAFDQNGNYTPLPESENEAKTITNLFGQKQASNNQLALRTEATEPSLKSNLEKPYRFIHIAGHSYANLKYPKFSGIACYEISNKAQNDGTLYTGEIYNLDVKADLVTLSSCESGIGKLMSSDGLLGINRAFIHAGASNVIFSLWKVYDKVSSKFMIDFYQNILDGHDYSQSLRLAKLKLLNEEPTATPHFWSPFLLIGR